MMSDSTAKRQQSQDVAERRRASAVVRPYVAQLDGWHGRAAMINATLPSRAGEPEVEARRQNARQLLTQVEAGHREFLQVLATERPHGRLDDVRAAFERLLATLRATVQS